MSEIVDSTYKDYKEMVQFLLSEDQPSLVSLADANLKKNLILCATSFFEVEITDSLKSYFGSKNPEAVCIQEFLVNKALKRQYHTLFDWDAANANKFFSLFGAGFKKYMEEKLRGDAGLSKSITSFLELGSERNRLVHQNFGSYSIEKTLEEIYQAYKNASIFVEMIIECLEEYHRSILELSEKTDD